MVVSIDRLQGVNSSSAVKVTVKCSSPSSLTLYGEQTVDGTPCVDGDRVLERSNIDKTKNGIYIVRTTDWERAKDFDGNYDVVQGTLVYVLNVGSGSLLYMVTTDNPIVIGSSNIVFTAVSASGGTAIVPAYSGLANGDYLKYNGSDWVNQTPSNLLSDISAQPLDDELTAISGVSSSANKVPYFTGVGTAGLLDFKDEDDMLSDSATAVASQQSIKAFVASEISSSQNSVFTSTEQSLSSLSKITLAHSLSSIPYNVIFYLVCKTAEYGYSVGDRIYNIPPIYDQGGAYSVALSVSADTTNVYVTVGGYLRHINQDTGAVVTLTYGNWNVVVRASV